MPAILLQRKAETTAYPHNILVWHEIVNHTIDGSPISLTFCPLCGGRASARPLWLPRWRQPEDDHSYETTVDGHVFDPETK